jgi:hypothetical protein
MSEGGDYDPGPWTGHDFDDARAAYARHASRAGSVSSGATASTRKSAGEMLEPRVSSTCQNPLVVLCDVTGSMQDWPTTMFSKLPYLEHEAKGYLGDDLEICFGAIGDAACDSYPLQVRPFAKGTALKDRMLELVIEQGGGGQLTESYELAALYAVHNVDIPKAVKPTLIMIGDEKPYPYISPEDAKRVAGVSLQGRLSAQQVFRDLGRKFSVYLVRKPYNRSGGDGMSSQDREIRDRWVELLGADRVVDLPEAGRVVDVIFGILANETGRFADFKEEIEGRQTPEQVATVYKSLKSIHTTSSRSGARGDTYGRSIMKLEHKGGESKPLM